MTNNKERKIPLKDFIEEFKYCLSDSPEMKFLKHLVRGTLHNSGTVSESKTS